MNGLIARVSALPYKLTAFHINFVNAMAGTINLFMRRGCIFCAGAEYTRGTPPIVRLRL